MRTGRARRGCRGDGARGDVANTFYFNVSSEDDASGVFRLHNNGIDLDWPTPIARHPVFEKIEMLLREFADAMGGRYVAFPTWRGIMDRKLVVLHPLGGCAVGATNAEGVVDGPAGGQGEHVLGGVEQRLDRAPAPGQVGHDRAEDEHQHGHGGAGQGDDASFGPPEEKRTALSGFGPDPRSIGLERAIARRRIQ